MTVGIVRVNLRGGSDCPQKASGERLFLKASTQVGGDMGNGDSC